MKVDVEFNRVSPITISWKATEAVTKKVILLENDLRYARNFIRAGEKNLLGVLCCRSVADFFRTVRRNEPDLIAVIVSYDFVQEMIEQHAFALIETLPLIVIDEDYQSLDSLENISSIKPTFVSKKHGAQALVGRILTENLVINQMPVPALNLN
jgi:hypothetical protein